MNNKNYKILYYPQKLKEDLFNLLEKSYPQFNTESYKEKFLIVIHDIYIKKFYNRRRYNIQGKNLHSVDYLREKLGLNRSTEFIKFLTENLFIEPPDHHYYEVGKKAYSYKIHERWNDHKISLNKHYVKRKDGPIAKVIKNDFKELNQTSPIVQYQRSLLDQLTFSDSFYDLLKEKYPDLDFKANQLPDNFTLKSLDHIDIFNFLYYEKYCKRRPYEYSRLYSNVVNTKREFRSHYLLNGKPLIEIDIKGCQIFLGAIKIQEHLNAEELPEDFLRFKETAVHDDIYLEFAKITAKEIDPEFDGIVQDDWDREQYKKWFFTFIWYAWAQTEKKNFLFEAFEKQYPSVAKVINELKKNNHVDFPVMLQNMEAEIMLDNVGKTLMDKKIKFLTIHDCFLVDNEPDAQFVKTTIEEAFIKEYGIKPGINIKKYANG